MLIVLSMPIAWRNSHCVGGFGGSSSITVSCSSIFGSDNFKVALYSFFGARGIGTNGATARVFKKNINCLITILMTSPKKGFVSDLKTHIARFQDSEFFRQLAHG